MRPKLGQEPSIGKKALTTKKDRIQRFDREIPPSENYRPATRSDDELSKTIFNDATPPDKEVEPLFQ